MAGRFESASKTFGARRQPAAPRADDDDRMWSERERDRLPVAALADGCFDETLLGNDDFDRLEEERENVRVALDVALEIDPELALELARRAVPSWVRRGDFREGRERLAAALCVGIRARGFAVLPWTDAARRLRERIGFLARGEPERWPAMDDAALLAGLEGWLGPYLIGCRRLADLQQLDLRAILERLLDHARRRELDRRAPARITVPSGREVAIDYAADPPTQSRFRLWSTPICWPRPMRIIVSTGFKASSQM